MIYLIKSAGYKEEEGNISTFFLLKIGYTEDNRKDIRFMQYKMHNPTCTILYIISEATEEHEKKVQYKFKNLLFPDYGREWFKYDQSIIDFFKNIKSLEELDNLPSNPVRGDRKVLLGRREARKILSYLFNSKEEIDKYLENLSSILGDTISYDTSLEYIKNDQGINKDKLEKYLKIIESKRTEIYCGDDVINKEVSKFMNTYDSITTKYEKLKLLCESNLNKDVINIVLNQIPESDEIRSYYTALGPQRLRALSYDITKIRKVLGIITFSQDLLLDSIYSSFKEGEKYTLANLKLKLSQLYSSINYSSTPKANDIEKYFDIKEYSQYEKNLDGSRKKIRGYELLKSKENELRQELKHTN